MSHEKHDLPRARYIQSVNYCDDDGGSGGVLDRQLKRSFTAGFSGSRGSVQNGHRDVHSLDRCGICTDVQYLRRESEDCSTRVQCLPAIQVDLYVGAKAHPRNNASSFAFASW